MGLPQHWLQDDVRAGMERLATVARARGVHLAIHTHVNNAESVTPLVAEATRAMLEAGVRDVRNQGVLMHGVNATTTDLLDLCFALLDGAGIMPYYFYMCDMIPFSEHWRVSVKEAQKLQHGDHGLPARVRDPADHLRRARSSASAGCTSSRSTTRSAASRTGRRTTAPASRPPTPTRCPGATSTTTRSTRCPRPGRRGGASTGPSVDHDAAVDARPRRVRRHGQAG